MTFFRLISHGKEFDVDFALANSSMHPHEIWHVGERSSFEKTATTSGFIKYLGDGSTLSVFEQQSIAFDFVTNHRDDLKRCGPESGAEYFMLFIQHRVEVYEELVGFVTEISRRLTAATLPLGMRVMTHVELVRLDRDL